MGKDPAFLFYPGDYLRDTQCLNEKSQVAYDRIICEHMRNIPVSKKQVDFFTKRLTDEDRADLFHVLTELDGGYQVDWVAESICKRKAYSESRRKNRQQNISNHIKTYDKHMENEIENENRSINKKVPTEKEFLLYGLKHHPEVSEKAIKLKYLSWVENDWHTAKGNLIKNWKTTLLNTLLHLKKQNDGKRNDTYIPVPPDEPSSASA